MRQAAENFAAEKGCTVTVNPTPYRVDGEVGRFSFPAYAVWQGRHRVWNTIPTILQTLGAEGVLPDNRNERCIVRVDVRDFLPQACCHIESHPS